MRQVWCGRAAVACSLLAGSALPAPGQPAVPLRLPTEAPLVIGSEAEDRDRVAQARDSGSTAGFLLRSLSSRVVLQARRDTLVWRVLPPELLVVRNTELPFSRNDGALWAGRGVSWRLSAGFAASWGTLRAVVLPEMVRSENEAFTDVDVTQWHRPFIDWGRMSRFASPWNQHPFSMDLPVRFGEQSFRRLTAGQSSLWVEGRGVAAGLSTENQWWGPGVHDALIMTNNAGGVPHAFVRTARPLRTRVGDFEARWMLGKLSESEYFDYDVTNDTRSLSAAVVTYRPSWERDLTVGVARAVYAPVSGTLAVPGRWLDVVRPFDRPNARPWSDSTLTGGRDQLASLFARWVFPRHGWEVWGEMGRAERPANLRDFLIEPNHTLGYVFGGQYVRPLERLGASLRLQTEFAQLEQSPSYRRRPTQSWYTSRASPQGYTHRGQVVGAGVGPGSSHQWLAADLLAPSWTAGLFVGRWRFNTDAMFLIPFPPGTGSCEYDVTLYPGARASVRHHRLGLLRAEVVFGNRLNAFHQNNSGCPNPPNANRRDVRNQTIRLWVQPIVFR